MIKILFFIKIYKTLLFRTHRFSPYNCIRPRLSFSTSSGSCLRRHRISYIKCGIANTTSSNNRRSSALDLSVRRCFRILYPAARRKWRRFTTRGDSGCTKYAGTTVVPQSVVAVKLTYRVLGYVQTCVYSLTTLSTT